MAPGLARLLIARALRVALLTTPPTQYRPGWESLRIRAGSLELIQAGVVVLLLILIAIVTELSVHEKPFYLSVAEVDEARFEIRKAYIGGLLFVGGFAVVNTLTFIWFAVDSGMLDERGGSWVVAAICAVIVLVHCIDALVTPFLLFRYTLLEKRVRRLQARISAADIGFDEAIDDLNETIAQVAEMNKQASPFFALAMLLFLWLAISSAAIFIWWNAHAFYVVTAIMSMLGQLGFAGSTVTLATALEELRPAALAVKTRRSASLPVGSAAVTNQWTTEEALLFDARIASEPHKSVRIFGADINSLSLARLHYINLAIIVFIFRGSNISVQSLLRLS